MKKLFRNGRQLKVATLLAFVFVGLAFILYSSGSSKEIRENNQQFLINDAEGSAKRFQDIISEGESSIEILSELIGENLNGPKLEIADYQKLISHSMFDFVEFADKDGMDHNITGGVSDAKDRKYYKEAMKGNSGVEVIFNSRATHENLLMFYSPVYYDGKVIGSLIGVYQASNKISEILSVSYFDNPAVIYLCNSKGKVFASNQDIDVTKEYTIEEIVNYSSEIEKNIQNAITNGYELKFSADNDQIMGCVTPIEGTEWVLVETFPVDVNMSMLRRMNAIVLKLVICILIIFILFQIVVYYTHQKQEKQIKEQLGILNSLTNIYYSMHLVNLSDFSTTEFITNDMLSAITKKSKNAIDMVENIMYATMRGECLEIGLEFTEMTTLAERMKGKKYLSMDLHGRNVGWIRMTFITVEADKKEIPKKIIVATQVIDEQKKREIDLLFKSNNDEMTGLLNRRAYDEAIGKILEQPNAEKIVFLSADVNGLKSVNDKYGHAAGDEIIIGAAECLLEAFGKLGYVYRTGGDEFLAILHGDSKDIDKAVDNLLSLTAKWDGKYVHKLSVSCGYASRKAYPDKSVHELEMIADQNMYAMKEEYYKKNGRG